MISLEPFWLGGAGPWHTALGSKGCPGIADAEWRAPRRAVALYHKRTPNSGSAQSRLCRSSTSLTILPRLGEPNAYKPREPTTVGRLSKGWPVSAMNYQDVTLEALRANRPHPCIL